MAEYHIQLLGGRFDGLRLTPQPLCLGEITLHGASCAYVYDELQTYEVRPAVFASLYGLVDVKSNFKQTQRPAQDTWPDPPIGEG